MDGLSTEPLNLYTRMSRDGACYHSDAMHDALSCMALYVGDVSDGILSQCTFFIIINSGVQTRQI